MKHLTLLAMLFSLNISASIADTKPPHCWDAFMEDGGNTIQMCTYHDLVSMTVFYPNGDQLGDENICQQIGNIDDSSPPEVTIDLSKGYCGGNRIIGAATLKCNKSNDALSCLYDGSINIDFKR